MSQPKRDDSPSVEAVRTSFSLNMALDKIDSIDAVGIENISGKVVMSILDSWGLERRSSPSLGIAGKGK